MSEPAAPYGNPRPRLVKPPDPRFERPDLRVLRELEESRSSEIASTPTSEPETTSPSSARKPGPYKTSDE